MGNSLDTHDVIYSKYCTEISRSTTSHHRHFLHLGAGEYFHMGTAFMYLKNECVFKRLTQGHRRMSISVGIERGAFCLQFNSPTYRAIAADRLTATCLTDLFLVSQTTHLRQLLESFTKLENLSGRTRGSHIRQWLVARLAEWYPRLTRSRDVAGSSPGVSGFSCCVLRQDT